MKEVLEVIKTRRSVRSYTEKQVEKEKLMQVLEAGAYGPHGLTLEKRGFTAIVGREKIAEINKCICDCLNMIPLTDDLHPYLKSLKQRAGSPDADFSYGAPVFVILTCNKDNGSAQLDCAASLENMLLAAHGIGLSACWMNQLPRFTEMPPARKLMASLGIPENHNVIGSMVLGYSEAKLTAPPAIEECSFINIIE